MTPKGTLIAVGGSEERNTESQGKLDVLKRIIKEMKGQQTRLELVTTASGIPRQIAKEYKAAFEHIGIKSLGIMHLKTKKDADKKDILERLKKCDGLMFSGGNQEKLSEVFLDTTALDILKHRYQNEKEFVIAGTSAGAMAQSEKMINGGTPSEAVKRGKAMMMAGLGFIDNAIIDSHFVNRGRFGRLMVAVAEHPKLTGIGISEDTGVIIKEERHLEIIGSGEVVIIDGHELRYNSLDNKEYSGLNIEHMIFHLLSAGMHYDLKTRKMALQEQH
ncbi:MAG: cyanophycinase [Chitinophagales bacterium]|jgi:cyanophycinase|nr:cyanophycinase [Bacteroidota bacterium]MBL0280085.1 cyanophycinase [Bacteroidota bacterium]MBP9880253.1 cyanophycinase [Chitinophagales bacterium]